MDSLTKKRRTTSLPSSLHLDFAIFSLNQITECGVLLLEVEEEGEVLHPLFANSCFCDLFGVAQDFYDGFHLSEFIAEKDVSSFKKYVSMSEHETTRLRILTRRQEEQKTTILQKDAKVTFSRFSKELVCCKFQLCDASLEERWKWYHLAEKQLGIAWAFYRVEKENRDLYAICENTVSQSKRKPHSNQTSFYYRSDGCFTDKELDWWVDSMSKLNENHLMETSTQEVTVFGVTHMYTIKHIFICRDESGFPIVMGISEDVTESNQLQTMLTDKQKELEFTTKCFKQFFDMAPLHMGIVKLVNDNTDTQYISANRCQEQRFGRSLKGVLGSSVSDPERMKKWINYYLEAKRTGNFIQFEHAFHDRLTNKTTHRNNYVAYLGDDAFAFLSQDITQTRQLEEELKQYQSELEEKIKERTQQLQEALQVKSRFLATMSHEMRTPLSGSMGAMSLLEETPLTPDQRNLVRIAQVCGQQLLSVINDVLDLTKLEENKVVLEKEPFDIRNTLEESLEMVCFEASKKGLELIGVIDPSVPRTVVGDSGRIRQIMVNLLGNAVKFSSKGEIVLRASAKPLDSNGSLAEITMSVQDEGIGIQEEDKHKLFEVFTQLDNSVTRRHGGTGLGLSICKRLAELMQGKIWFESCPGKGSIFHTTIIAPIVPQSPFLGTMHYREGRPLKCAIVDKSRTWANHLKTLLENLGNFAECFTNLEDVQGANCLFVDVRFGLNSIQQTRSSQVKHIIITAYTTRQLKIPSEYFLLEKPLRESKLKQLLEDIRNPKPAVLSQSNPENPTWNVSTDISILLAEDNEMNQQIITRMLNNLSFSRITVVGNGLEAIEQIRNKHYDLVFMDVMMPEMGGIEATEIIRNEFGEKPVIVALTANAFAEDRVRCLEAGMQEVLTKPVQKSQLLKIFSMFFAN